MVRMVRVGGSTMTLEVANQIGDVAKHVLGFRSWVWMMSMITWG